MSPAEWRYRMKNDAAYQNMEEDAYDMVASYTHAEELISMKDLHKKQGGKVDMCGAIAGLIAEGKIEGEECKLVKQVCKKLKKNKSVATIAEELEEEQEKIQSICEAAKEYAPEFDCEKVYQTWKEKYKLL